MNLFRLTVLVVSVLCLGIPAVPVAAQAPEEEIGAPGLQPSELVARATFTVDSDGTLIDSAAEIVESPVSSLILGGQEWFALSKRWDSSCSAAYPLGNPTEMKVEADLGHIQTLNNGLIAITVNVPLSATLFEIELINSHRESVGTVDLDPIIDDYCSDNDGNGICDQRELAFSRLHEISQLDPVGDLVRYLPDVTGSIESATNTGIRDLRIATDGTDRFMKVNLGSTGLSDRVLWGSYDRAESYKIALVSDFESASQNSSLTIEFPEGTQAVAMDLGYLSKSDLFENSEDLKDALSVLAEEVNAEPTGTSIDRVTEIIAYIEKTRKIPVVSITAFGPTGRVVRAEKLQLSAVPGPNYFWGLVVPNGAISKVEVDLIDGYEGFEVINNLQFGPIRDITLSRYEHGQVRCDSGFSLPMLTPGSDIPDLPIPDLTTPPSEITPVVPVPTLRIPGGAGGILEDNQGPITPSSGSGGGGCNSNGGQANAIGMLMFLGLPVALKVRKLMRSR